MLPASLSRRLAALCALGFCLMGLPGVPAGGTSCPPAGGEDQPIVADWSKAPVGSGLLLADAGSGHGIGLSQWGAHGAARLGCTYADIIATYYQGARIAPAPMPETVRVGLLDLSKQPGTAGAEAAITAVDGDVGWLLHSCGNQLGDPCPVQPPVQSQGSTWRIRSVRSADPARDGAFLITNEAGAPVFQGGDASALLDANHEGTLVRLALPDRTRESRWGFTRFHPLPDGDGKLFVVEHITPGDGVSGMERYLWGLAEVPPEWPEEALKAQAVAARSYAMHRIGLASRETACHCDVFPVPERDQTWTGWAWERRDPSELGKPWKRAVNATAGEVAWYGSDIIAGFYDTSHGGWTESALDVWGQVDIPHLRPVDTSRWEHVGGDPHQRWSVGFPSAELARRFQLSRFLDFRVMARGAGGRPTAVDADRDGQPDGIRVLGLDGSGGLVTRWYSGDQVRWILGIRSFRMRAFPVTTVRWERLHDSASAGHLGTAVAITRRGWPGTSTSVVIVRDDQPADGLAAAALAGKLHAPLLLTPPEGLDPRVLAEVTRLHPALAYVVGDPSEVSPRIDLALFQAGVVPLRVFGVDEPATAAAVADHLGPPPDHTAYLVADSPQRPDVGWPDGLSVAAAAARLAHEGSPRPVLLTEPDALPLPTLLSLARLGVRQVVLAGGSSVISEEVADQLRQLGFEVARIAGEDRYATSRAVADAHPAPPGTLLVTGGGSFAEALPAAALAGQLQTTFVLVPGEDLDLGNLAWVARRGWQDPNLIVAGGPESVSEQTAGMLRQALSP